MPISEVSLTELIMVGVIIVPFLILLTMAEGGKGPGPSYRGIHLKKRR